MPRPGRWFATAFNVPVSAIGVNAISIIFPTPPTGSTIERILLHVDVFEFFPGTIGDNSGLIFAIHNLGAGAQINQNVHDQFPDHFMLWEQRRLFAHTESPGLGTFWDRQSYDFDLRGKRDMTTSNPEMRFAYDFANLPGGATAVISWSTRTFLLDPP